MTGGLMTHGSGMAKPGSRQIYLSIPTLEKKLRWLMTKRGKEPSFLAA